MSLLFADRDWDYLVKKTRTKWVSKNAFGKTLATEPTSTGLQSLLNAVLTEKGDTPGLVKISTNGEVMNIDGPVYVPSRTTIQGEGQNQITRIQLEAASDCHMFEPLGGSGVADNIANVFFKDLNIDGNDANQGAGNYDCISWDIDDAGYGPGSGNFRMLALDNCKVDNGKRYNILARTDGDYVGESGATIMLNEIKSYSAGGIEIYMDRIFDGSMRHIQVGEMYLQGVDSIQIEDVYVAGAHSPNLHLKACEELILTDVRSDNSSGKSVLVEDCKWVKFNGLSVTNLNELATDDNWNGIEIDNSDQTQFYGLDFVKNPTETAIDYEYGIQELNSTTNTLVCGANFSDACQTAEIDELDPDSVWANCYYVTGAALTAARIV